MEAAVLKHLLLPKITAHDQTDEIHINFISIFTAETERVSITDIQRQTQATTLQPILRA